MPKEKKGGGKKKKKKKRVEWGLPREKNEKAKANTAEKAVWRDLG